MSLSDRMICYFLSVLNSLKLLCFLCHLGKQNCTDLHLSSGRGGSTGTVLSAESGNVSETAMNRGERAPERTSTAASSTELSSWVPLGSAAVAPRDGGMPTGSGAGAGLSSITPAPGAGASPPGSRSRTRSRRRESKPVCDLHCL